MAPFKSKWALFKYEMWKFKHLELVFIQETLMKIMCFDNVFT